METIIEYLKYLPSASTSTLAYLGYITLAGVLFYSTYSTGRLRALSKTLKHIPQESRASLLKELTHADLPPERSPEQWLQGRQQRYWLIALFAVLFTTLSIVAMAIWSGIREQEINKLTDTTPQHIEACGIQIEQGDDTIGEAWIYLESGSTWSTIIQDDLIEFECPAEYTNAMIVVDMKKSGWRHWRDIRIPPVPTHLGLLRMTNSHMGKPAGFTPPTAEIHTQDQPDQTTASSIGECNHETLIDICEELCKTGNVDACHQLGYRAYAMANEERSVEFYQKGCERANGASCLNEGDIREKWGEHTRARQLYETACTHNILEGCLRLARLHVNGLGGKKNVDDASIFYRKACSSGSIDGCVELATYIQKGVVPGTDAKELLEKACEERHPAACAEVAAELRAKGQESSAKRKFESACKLGSGKACFAMAEDFRLGLREPETPEVSATIYYRKACNRRFFAGCVSYGERLAAGTGISKSVSEARTAYQRACDGGAPAGCMRLAEAYFTGAGLRKDDTEARRLYEVSCKAGHAAGCADMGLMVESGYGGKQDAILAREYYSLSCNGGHVDGCIRMANSLDRDSEDSTNYWRSACHLGYDAACSRIR